jgi:pyridoxamine 5'-phosphate oxidase
LSIENLRRDYTFGDLQRSQLPVEPIPLFENWFAQLQAISLPDWFEINAMTLSTSLPSGKTSSRVVLLKQLDPDGFLFFTNYDSHKGEQIEQNNSVALHFFWPVMDRQVRVEGKASKTSSEVSDKYFASRPRSSQLSALASPQSQVIDENDLQDLLANLERRHEGVAVPRPSNWGGYKVVPFLMEFWQGKPSRLHDRFRYQRLDGEDGWLIDRLAP